MGVHLVRVQTNPNDRMLWALDSRCNVYVRTGITEEMPVGTAWEHIPGTPSLYFSLLFCLICFVSSLADSDIHTAPAPSCNLTMHYNGKL